MNRRAIITAGVVAWLALGPTAAHAVEKKNNDTYRLLELFGDVFERVRGEYVEEVKDEELLEAALNGMLTSLDPHSNYMNPKTFRDMQVQNKGEFGGLGIEVTMENGWVKVVSPIDDTPAFRAGLQPNDFITHLDGEPVLGLTLNDAVDRMRGPVNSDIRLTIRREGVQPFDVSLTRAVVRVQSVKSTTDGNVGYLRISSFTEQTDAGLRKAVADLKKDKGKALQGLVVDLRNNPGGLLDQAVAVAGDFIDKGEIVSTRSRRPEDTQRFNAHGKDLVEGLPVVVLVNDGSASASEIVAGALQDHHRALIMGTKTFGKGSVQTVIPLPGHGAIKLTTARYYTPSGRSIQAVGIEPDIKVAQAKLEPVAVNDRDRRSEAALRGALKNELLPGQTPADKPSVAPAPAIPAPGTKAPGPGSQAPGAATPAAAAAAPGTPPPPKLGDPGQDYQLARAYDLIRALSLYNKQAAN